MKKAVLILFAMLAGSCSLIYEDRSACPCLLTIDYEECNGYPIGTVQSILIGEDNAFDFRTRIQPFRSIDTAVDKGIYLLSVWGNGFLSLSRQEILPDDRDELYSFLQKVDCTSESLYLQVKPIPEFAETTIRILDKIGSIRHAELTGCNKGFSLNKNFLSETSIKPLELGKEGKYYVGRTNLLRMNDVGTLKIRLSDGKSVLEYPVGRILKENGYDMTKDFLDPIEIVIDTVLGEIVIKTQDWEAVESTDIIF